MDSNFEIKISCHCLITITIIHTKYLYKNNPQPKRLSVFEFQSMLVNRKRDVQSGDPRERHHHGHHLFRHFSPHSNNLNTSPLLFDIKIFLINQRKLSKRETDIYTYILSFYIKYHTPSILLVLNENLLTFFFSISSQNFKIKK